MMASRWEQWWKNESASEGVWAHWQAYMPCANKQGAQGERVLSMASIIHLHWIDFIGLGAMKSLLESVLSLVSTF